jgi:uncharacterized protein (TIGR02246 family)
MDASVITAWVDAYVRAWNSNDPADIGRLFTDDALYYTGPFDEPWKGRAAIIQKWLRRQDAPGTTSFRYEVLASTFDQAVVRGWTLYHDPEREYSNVWFLRFGSDGRCREFTEWWIKRPTPRARAGS